ncbi:MAG: archaellin/type IV pilin N-terminal domain-containing protein [Nitrososphaeria archaeon]|jgi:flagellin-like protein
MYLKKRKGISPVIATVILIAVAVAIAIAVAFWAAGLVGTFTKYEKIDVVSAYSTNDQTVVLQLKNAGSSSATIVAIFVNGEPLSAWTGPAGTISWSTIATGATTTAIANPEITPLSLPVGASVIMTITFSTTAGMGLVSGNTYAITVHSAAGNDYPASVVAP